MSQLSLSSMQRWGYSSVVERPLRMREARGSIPRISSGNHHFFDHTAISAKKCRDYNFFLVDAGTGWLVGWLVDTRGAYPDQNISPCSFASIANIAFPHKLNLRGKISHHSDA